MSSVKKQKARLARLKAAEIKRERINGTIRLSVPDITITNTEILKLGLSEAVSSFGIAGCESKDEEAELTSWFGFDQESLIRFAKLLVHNNDNARSQQHIIKNTEVSHNPLDQEAFVEQIRSDIINLNKNSSADKTDAFSSCSSVRK